MKLRTLVVEDEWATREYLTRVIQASGEAEVVGAVASAEAARQVLDTAPGAEALDLAFVDVELVGGEGEGEGLTLVREYARRPGAPAFVLATAFPGHVSDAFELDVVDYLLKPFNEERVARCLARVQARRTAQEVRHVPRPDSNGEATRLVARRKRALVFLRLDEVWAFESAERLAYVHTARGRFEIDLSLSAVESSIGRTLLRTHRSWLVNPDHVKELEGRGSETTLWVGGEGPTSHVRVPVSRDRAQVVREALLASTMGIRAR